MISITQTIILDGLRQTKDFEVIKSWKMGKKVKPFDKTPLQIKQNCGYCGSGNPHQQCPAYGQMCWVCRKTNHFKAVCRNNNGRRVRGHDMEQEATNDNQIDMVNINCIMKNLIFYEISICWQNVWLQMGVKPMPVTFWVSALTIRPLRPAILPVPSSKGCARH